MGWVATPSRDSRATGRSGGSGAWCRRDSRRQNGDRSRIERSARLLHAAIDFGDRVRELGAPAFVGGGGELTIELEPGQPERFERLHFLRIAHRPAALLVLALALEFLHPLLNAPFRVDQPFSGVAHQPLRPRMKRPTL